MPLGPDITGKYGQAILGCMECDICGRSIPVGPKEGRISTVNRSHDRFLEPYRGEPPNQLLWTYV